MFICTVEYGVYRGVEEGRVRDWGGGKGRVCIGHVNSGLFVVLPLMFGCHDVCDSCSSSTGGVRVRSGSRVEMRPEYSWPRFR